MTIIPVGPPVAVDSDGGYVPLIHLLVEDGRAACGLENPGSFVLSPWELVGWPSSPMGVPCPACKDEVTQEPYCFVPTPWIVDGQPIRGVCGKSPRLWYERLVDFVFVPAPKCEACIAVLTDGASEGLPQWLGLELVDVGGFLDPV